MFATCWHRLKPYYIVILLVFSFFFSSFVHSFASSRVGSHSIYRSLSNYPYRADRPQSSVVQYWAFHLHAHKINPIHIWQTLASHLLAGKMLPMGKTNAWTFLATAHLFNDTWHSVFCCDRFSHPYLMMICRRLLVDTLILSTSNMDWFFYFQQPAPAPTTTTTTISKYKILATRLFAVNCMQVGSSNRIPIKYYAMPYIHHMHRRIQQ